MFVMLCTACTVPMNHQRPHYNCAMQCWPHFLSACCPRTRHTMLTYILRRSPCMPDFACVCMAACRLAELAKPAGQRKCDVVAAGVSATSERIASGFKFSYPTFQVQLVSRFCMAACTCRWSMPLMLVSLHVQPHACMLTLACRGWP